MSLIIFVVFVVISARPQRGEVHLSSPLWCSQSMCHSLLAGLPNCSPLCFLLLHTAKMQLPVPQWHPSGVVKLTPKDFQTYIELVVSELTGNEDEVLDNIVEFLMTTLELSHMERLRGSARRKWLRGIQHIAKCNGRSMEPVYQAVFWTLCKVGVLALAGLYMGKGCGTSQNINPVLVICIPRYWRQAKE